ncbi:MAG TPA: signal peptidase I [Symbiobacteriaceae bacterium]|nr:signal peptidase I [Symbiobacteriaceae bacterium]
MKLALKVLNILTTGALVLIIVAAAVLGFSARRSGDAIPTIAGHKVLSVLSGSMEPGIHTGDVIVVKPLADPAAEIKDGDIITFRVKEKPDMLITHRVMGTIKVAGKPIGYTTKGDNNEVIDREVVAPEQVLGRYEWRIPYFGYISSFIRKPLGIGLFVVLPGVIIIGLEFRKMWRLMTEEEARKKAEAEAEAATVTDPEKDQAQ